MSASLTLDSLIRVVVRMATSAGAVVRYDEGEGTALTDDAVNTWLLIQGGSFLAFSLLFGLLFPVAGVLLTVLNVPSPGGDGVAPWVTMAVAGPCTSVFYLPGGIVSLVARRKLQADAARALPWLIAAGALTLVVCPLGIVPVLAVATRRP